MLAVATVACRPLNMGIRELKHIYETEVVRSVNKVPIYGDTNRVHMGPVLVHRLHPFSVIAVFYGVRCPSVTLTMHESCSILNIIVENLVVAC
jgi:hypothetical protein